MGADAAQAHGAADATAFVEQAGLMDGMSDYSFVTTGSACSGCTPNAAVYRTRPFGC